MLDESMKFPSDIRLQLTSRCNLQCQYCFSSSSIQGNIGELSDARILSLIEEITEQGIKALSLTGGEPLLREGLVLRILESLKGHSIITTLNTNGWFLNSQSAQELIEAGLQRVQISLDSHDYETHDSIRGVNGSYLRAVNAIEHCVEVGLETLVRVTITPLNYHSMPEILKFVQSKEAHSVVVKPLIPSGRGRQVREKLTHEQQKAAITDLIDSIKRNQRISREYVQFLSPSFPFLIDEDYATNAEKCHCGEDLAFITAIGDVQPCGYTHHILGNILEVPLGTIWKKSQFLKTWVNDRISGKCKSCDHATICQGGCRAAAYEVTGQLDVPDPMCWRREEY